MLRLEPVRIPVYDKAAFSGQGDRHAEDDWPVANWRGDKPAQVVILEGWCVGFRCLNPEAIRAQWEGPSRSLQRHKLEHLLLINEKLSDYDAITDLFDGFIHIDSEDLDYMYAWRQEQEESMRHSKGDASIGMTAEQVMRFVDGYYPAYELYLQGLRRGVFHDRRGCQLGITVGRDRGAQKWTRI